MPPIWKLPTAGGASTRLCLHWADWGAPANPVARAHPRAERRTATVTTVVTVVFVFVIVVVVIT